jgi:hypothetical protein
MLLDAVPYPLQRRQGLLQVIRMPSQTLEEIGHR